LVIVIAVLALTLFTGRAEAIDSIAVLPLENLTGDTEKEFFVDVATEELIGQLGQISGLRRVISRTTVMKYKETDKTLSEIARELNVDVVVEGSVQQAGDRVRIQVRLIDALPEEQNLWGQTYERAMSDVLVMYGEMARAIADKAKIDLTANELTGLTSASQVSPESYDAYIKGRFHYNKTTPEGIKLALQYFELALEIDPNNALAYLGVAHVWGGRYQVGLSPRHEALPLRKAALEKALEIDNRLAEAHHVLAGTKCWSEWDWEGAETEYQQVFKLNPNYSRTHAFYAHFLCHMGRTEEALPYIERALELDPLNSLYYGLYGVVLAYNRRFDDALAAARTSLDMVPGHPIGRYALKEALISKGMYDELLAHYRERFTKFPERAVALEDGFEKADNKGAFRAIGDLLAKWYGKPDRGVIRAWDIARFYIIAGDYELAIEWLEKAYEDHEPNLPYIGMPSYDPLLSYPRFKDLLRKIGLPVDEKE
jgi:TolB-like protein